MCQYRMAFYPWAVVCDQLILGTFETVEQAELYRKGCLNKGLFRTSTVDNTNLRVLELTEYDCIEVIPTNAL